MDGLVYCLSGIYTSYTRERTSHAVGTSFQRYSSEVGLNLEYVGLQVSPLYGICKVNTLIVTHRYNMKYWMGFDNGLNTGSGKMEVVDHLGVSYVVSGGGYTSSFDWKHGRVN